LEHPNGHWGTSACVFGPQELARLYNGIYYGDGGYPPPNPLYHNVLSFNDMSIVGGGKFDLSSNFADSGDHVEHRFGRECDVRNNNIDADRYANMARLFDLAGIVSVVNHTVKPHWHVRFPQ
jgi:hypothetical protein